MTATATCTAVITPEYIETFAHTLKHLIKSEASIQSVNAVQAHADSLALQVMESPLEDVKHGIAAIIDRMTLVYTEERLDYDKVVWPSMFLARLIEHFGEDAFNRIMERSERLDEFNALIGEFTQWHKARWERAHREAKSHGIDPSTIKGSDLPLPNNPHKGKWA